MYKSYFSNSTGRIITCLIVMLAYNVSVRAQTVNPPDVHDIVGRLVTALTDQYPFPALSAQYKEALIKNEAAGSYKGLSELALAEKVTADLQLVHKDVHLHIYRSESQYRNLTVPDSKAANDAAETALFKKQNYGFKNVDLDLTSSTAYINIPGPFYARQEAFEVAAAAMNMAAYSSHVIIDLRSNRGGSGEMGRFLASYFFEAGNEQFYLNGFYKDRAKDEQEWTYSYVPGKRNPTARVYILVGPGTGSAAEGFAFAMQKLKRATIVGETTAGAGIAGSFMPLKNNLIVFLPFKMVVAPNTQVGWEGVGVIPDSATTGKDALTETRKFILQDIVNTSTDSIAKAAAQWSLEESKMPAGNLADGQTRYAGFAGKYNNDVTVISAKDNFIWRKAEKGKPVQNFVMREIRQDLFIVVGANPNFGLNSTRIYVSRDASGKITSLEKRVLLSNGSIYIVPELYRQVKREIPF